MKKRNENVKVKTSKIPVVVADEQGDKAQARWDAACAWAKEMINGKRIVTGDGKDYFGAGSHTREAMIHFVYFANTWDYSANAPRATPETSSAAETILRVQALQALTSSWVKGEDGRVSTAGAINAHRASLKNKYFDGENQVYCASDSPRVTKAKGGEFLTPSALALAITNYSERKMLPSKVKGGAKPVKAK